MKTNNYVCFFTGFPNPNHQLIHVFLAYDLATQNSTQLATGFLPDCRFWSFPFLSQDGHKSIGIIQQSLCVLHPDDDGTLAIVKPAGFARDWCEKTRILELDPDRRPAW